MSQPLLSDPPEQPSVTDYFDNLNKQNRPTLLKLASFIAHLFEVPAVLFNLTTTDGQPANQISYGLDATQLYYFEAAFQFYPDLFLKEQVIENIQLDPAFAATSLIMNEPAPHFYASVPLQTQFGNLLGGLCLLDWQPRTLTATQFSQLQELASIAVNQLELNQDLLNLVEISTTIKKISQFTAVLTGENFFHAVVQQIASTLGAEYVFIGELLGGGQLNYRTIATYERGQLRDNFEATLSNTPAQAIINQKTVIYPYGVQTLFPEDRLLKSNGIESYLAIPLVSFDGTVLGLLAVMSRQPLKDFRMARMLFDMFSSRITIELKHRQVEQRLALQYGVTRVLAESDSLKTVTSHILQAIGETLKRDVGALWKVDQRTNLLRCVQTWHTPGQNFTEFEKVNRETTFSIGKGLPGEVWVTRQSAWITDIAEATNFSRASAAFKAGLHGAFGFPIISKGALLGVIEFFGCDIHYPDHKLLQLFSAIGAQVGQFMERKQAEEALRRSMGTNRALLNALPDLMFRVSRDGTYVNYKAPKNVNFITPPENYMGKNLAEILPAEIVEAQMQLIHSVLQNGGVETLEYQLEADNKLQAAGYYEARFVTSAEDEVMIIIRDITKRKKAEKELEIRAYRQAMVAQLGQQALAANDTLVLLNQAVKLVVETLELDYSGVLELLPDQNAFIMRAGAGWSREMIGYITNGVGINSFCDNTLRSIEPRSVEDWRNQPASPETDMLHSFNIISSMSVAIHGPDGHPYGILTVHSTTKRPFNQDDANFLQTVANILATALERNRIQEAWRESQAWLHTVSTNAPIILIAINNEGIYTLSEGKGLEKLGWQPGEIVGRSVFDPVNSTPELAKNFQRALAGESFSTTIDVLDIAFEAWYIPMYDRDKKITGIIAVATDISERRRAEQELTIRAQRQAALAQCGQLALVGTDLDILLNQMSTLVAETLEVKYCSVMELLPNEKALLLRAGIGWREESIGQRRVGSGTGSLAGYTLLLGQPITVEDWSKETRCNGTYLLHQYKLVSSLCVMIDGLSGREPFGAIAVHSATPRHFTQDDTDFLQTVTNILASAIERLRAEEEIHKALEKEKELSELKSRFVSMTSHEFRTPLATILTNAEMLKEYSHRLSEEKKQTLFQRIEIAIAQMTDLLNDVLVIGKAEAGKLEFNPITIKLGQFCQNLVEEIRLGIGKKHQLNFIYAKQFENMLASVDEKLLRHILTNLLSNAIKYSKPGSIIEFELAYDLVDPEPKAIFHIKDQGIGIPVEDQQRMFEIFHRARNVGTIQGTGLGLAIVKRSVEMHNGTISMNSTVGAGTNFTITIPTHNEAQNYTEDL